VPRVVPARVDATVDVRLVPRPATKDSVELGADDLDVDFYVDDSSISTAWWTETTLALPMKPLCREDCGGSARRAAGNRNLVACACAGRASTRAWPRCAIWRRACATDPEHREETPIAAAEATPLRHPRAQAPHPLQAGTTDAVRLPAVPRGQAAAPRVSALRYYKGREIVATEGS